jgi:precorrin-6B C5,15-methyltransferase / cobalt-precorrin-6B C5,C15-methyltransferase
VITFDQLSAGLPDEAFVTDGLLTKRVLRAYALAVLAPRPGEVLWDLGAGTGSIGIEWCRLHRENLAIAVERNADRADRISVNAANLGVAGQLTVVVGGLAESIDGLPAPDAVFFGGGLSESALDQCWQWLPDGGRLVAHSVTIESDAVLVAAQARWGGELVRIGVEIAEPLGALSGFKPFRTVTAWQLLKAEWAPNSQMGTRIILN